MRGLRRRWVVGSIPGDAREPLARRLLRMRGGGDERARRILESPRLQDLHPPGTLPGAAAVGDALARALRDGRRIAIYGDYDVDGITATAILWRLLRTLSPDCGVTTYLPHRMEEGYGLNAAGLRELAAQGVRTVVTVDCGITAIEEAKVAESLGLELLVTDHHAIEASGASGRDALLPMAAAIAHPDLPGEAAPFRGLCGAAVAWKVACATASAWCGGAAVPEGLRRTLVELLPFVALGTIADVMSLEDENRVLASHGLRRLVESTIPGLAALVRSEARGRRPDAETIGFRLAPMLNACGRLGHAAEALELLTSADARRSTEIVRSLAALNEERKRLERACVEQAILTVDREGLAGDDRRAIVIAGAGWHEGVVGVACSRLVERFGRPTVLLQDRGESAKGSGRSVPSVHLLECLRACTQVSFMRLGGHAMAAGLEVSSAQVPDLREALVEQVNQRLAPEALAAELAVDGRAGMHELDLAALRELSILEPFGRGNPRPRFLLESVMLSAPPRRMGAGEHCELWIVDPERRSSARRAVWWSGLPFASELPVGTSVDLVVEAKVDGFKGVDEALLTVLDAREPSPRGGAFDANERSGRQVRAARGAK